MSINGDLERRAKIKAAMKAEKDHRQQLIDQAVAELEKI